MIESERTERIAYSPNSSAGMVAQDKNISNKHDAKGESRSEERHDIRRDTRRDVWHSKPVSDLFHLRVSGWIEDRYMTILTPQALLFLEELEQNFGARRRELLRRRQERIERLNRETEKLNFLDSTVNVRTSDWKVAATPPDLLDRRVEITGPVDRKMMINALNSGARVFMADLEDATSPTWENVMDGQINLKDAVRRRLTFGTPDGREYLLKEKIATLLVRPRGWHLEEKNVRFDGNPVSASLVDFGLYFFHNAHELISRGSGPYFYLPKIESHLEARLWNDVFTFSQERLGIKKGTIRATVLIETLPAAFEMDEILYELREHASGLNAGRWDYLFSTIKTLGANSEVTFPDRAQLTMTVPFMRAYTKLLVATCHKRDAHAIGGMAAFIPSRKDAEVNRMAIAKVREDKLRESSDGFDGTWVAHPDLVPIADEIFSSRFGAQANQRDFLAEEGFSITARDLHPTPIEGGRITPEGVDNNIDVSLRYISSWLQGQGAVAIHNLMEDAATAEISRALLWQWVRREVTLTDGTVLTRDEFRRRLEAERACFAGQAERGRLSEACGLLEALVLADEFREFLTLPAYHLLES